MDMEPLIPKAIWGFNGTERPGAVYLAAVSAAHAQKGLPAFTIYGRDVQDIGSTAIPAEVREKLLRFVKGRLGRGHDAGQVVPVRRRGFDGDRRFDRQPGLLRGQPRDAGGMRGHDRTGPPHRGEGL